MTSRVLVLAVVLTAAAGVSGCGGGGSSSPTLTGAAARTADDEAARVRTLLTRRPPTAAEHPRPFGPVRVAVPARYRDAAAGPASAQPGWTFKRLTDPQGDSRASLGLIVAPVAASTPEQSARTVATTGGSRDAGRASGIMTTTTWQGVPAYLVYVNTSTGLHVEALCARTRAGTVTVIAQGPVEAYDTTGLRRALTSVDLQP